MNEAEADTAGSGAVLPVLLGRGIDFYGLRAVYHVTSLTPLLGVLALFLPRLSHHEF